MAGKRRSMAEFLNLAEAGESPVTDGLKRELPIEKLMPRSNQPRQTLDPAELEQMATTIRALGVIQPLVVRPLDNQPEGDYEIVAGERRWRAAQQAGLNTVPAIIRHMDERHADLYSLAENVARSDLNPLELAKGYYRAVKEHGFSQTELAAAIGQNVKTVNRTLRLLKLPELIQEMIAQGSLTAKHGEVLLGSPKARQLELAQRAVAQEWSVRELERQSAKPPLQREPSHATTGDAAREQTLWRERLGAEVRLRYAKTGKVQITITAASLDDYQSLRERLGIRES